MDRYGNYSVNGVPASGVLLQLANHVKVISLHVEEAHTDQLEQWTSGERVQIIGPAVGPAGAVEERTVYATYTGCEYTSGGFICGFVLSGRADDRDSPKAPDGNLRAAVDRFFGS